MLSVQNAKLTLYFQCGCNVDAHDIGMELTSVLTAGKVQTSDYPMLIGKSLGDLAGRGWPVQRLLQLDVVQDIKIDELPPVLPPTTYAIHPLHVHEQFQEVTKADGFVNCLDRETQVALEAINFSSNTKNSYPKMLFDNTQPLPPFAGVAIPKHCSRDKIQELEYVDKVMEVSLFKEKSISNNKVKELIPFAMKWGHLLKSMATNVFKFQSVDCLHIFIDDDSTAFAFNSGGNLFFNLAVYMDMKGKAKRNEEIILLLFLTFCHEISHNQWSDHNEQFDFLFEHIVLTFVEECFLKLPWLVQDAA